VEGIKRSPTNVGACAFFNNVDQILFHSTFALYIYCTHLTWSDCNRNFMMMIMMI